MWVGAVMLIIGILGAGGWLIAEIPDVSDRIDRFHRASPELPAEFTVTETVDWDVFIEPETASRARFRFQIVSVGGDPVQLGREHGFSYGWFGRSGRSIASVVLEPGTYRMEVTEGSSTVALGSSPGAAILQAFGGAALIVFLVGGAGVAVMIVSAVRDTRRRNENAEPPPPSPWSSGEWQAEPGR